MRTRWMVLLVSGCVGLTATACGADDASPAEAVSVPSSVTSQRPAIVTSTSASATVTTVPLVTVPAGGDIESDGPTTTAPPATSTTTTIDVVPTAPTVAPPLPSPPAGGAPIVGDGAATEVEDLLESVPTVAPPEGAGTAIRVDIGPIDGLAVGDVITIEATNLPPDQWMAWGQCSEAGKDSVDLEVLLSSCGGFGFGFSSAEGTATEQVIVSASVGGVDCAVAPCYVGVVVLPGTDDYRRYERISLGA